MREEFLKYMNNCFMLIDENYSPKIYYFYNENYIRQRKLNRTFNIKDNIEIDIKNSELYFEADYINRYFFINSDKIFSVFEKKYNMSYFTLSSTLKNLFKSDPDFIVPTPENTDFTSYVKVGNRFKLSPSKNSIIWVINKKELNQLIPYGLDFKYNNYNGKFKMLEISESKESKPINKTLEKYA